MLQLKKAARWRWGSRWWVVKKQTPLLDAEEVATGSPSFSPGPWHILLLLLGGKGG